MNPSTPIRRWKALQGFDHASPELLKARTLQHRVDTKCLIAHETLEELLATVRSDYAVLLAAGRNQARYRTVYLDTPHYQALEDHHRGRRPRFKARVRHYLDREVSYLEVKEKTRANDTRKSRLRMRYGNESLGAKELNFLEARMPVQAGDLVHTLRTSFHRITLLGKRSVERVTIDLDLILEGEDTRAALPDAVIVEVKQEHFQPRSPVMLALRSAQIFPASVSKYCTAAALLLPEVRMHSYKETLRALGRIHGE